jgi:DNA-binding transcriptional LysR family regulator
MSTWWPKGMTWLFALATCRTVAWWRVGLEEARLCLVAAPAYLARAGRPQSLAELAGHNCLPFIMPSNGRPGVWQFRQGEEELLFVPQGNPVVADDVLGCISLAEQGVGICQTYEFIVAERLQRGRLVRLLEDYEGPDGPSRSSIRHIASCRGPAGH